LLIVFSKSEGLDSNKAKSEGLDSNNALEIKPNLKVWTPRNQALESKPLDLETLESKPLDLEVKPWNPNL
jgi:hypothetical protein